MDGIFGRYGVSAQVETAAGTVQTKVFFRHVRSDAWQNVEQAYTPLGRVSRGRYICLLPAGVAVALEDTLTVNGKKYLLRQVEQTLAFDRTVCQWCLCVEKGQDANGE